MKIYVTAQPFEPWQTLGAYQETVAAGVKGRFGATCAFVGTMRDFNEDDDVLGMTLEHYPGMTERELQRIADEACERWALVDLLLVHRVGELTPGDPIVLVSVWSAHRGNAFEACRYMMEALKSRAPFWKKEQLADGTRWVQKNAPAQPTPKRTTG